jgi:hypothetical protein
MEAGGWVDLLSGDEFEVIDGEFTICRCCFGDFLAITLNKDGSGPWAAGRFHMAHREVLLTLPGVARRGAGVRGEVFGDRI